MVTFKIIQGYGYAVPRDILTEEELDEITKTDYNFVVASSRKRNNSDEEVSDDDEIFIYLQGDVIDVAEYELNSHETEKGFSKLVYLGEGDSIVDFDLLDQQKNQLDKVIKKEYNSLYKKLKKFISNYNNWIFCITY